MFSQGKVRSRSVSAARGFTPSVAIRVAVSLISSMCNFSIGPPCRSILPGGSSAVELPPGFWSEEPTALLRLFLRRLRLFHLGVRLDLLSRRDATAAATLFFGPRSDL